VYAVMDVARAPFVPVKVELTRRAAQDWRALQENRDTLRVKRARMQVYAT
jgi:hypothetical protein